MSARKRLVLAGVVSVVLVALTFQFRARHVERPTEVLIDQRQVVPEPHEFALLAGLGLLGFAVWRRRRHRD